MSASRPVRGRLAPSPTGFLHLGNAWAFLLAWLACRSKGGSLVLRMEDIDPDRSRPEYADAIIRSSIWGSTRRFLTWSRQATPLGFSYFLLSPSAHGMSAKELSSSAILLPTPLASDTGDVGKTVDVRMTPTGSFRKYNPSGTVWTARLSWAVYKLLGSPPGDVKLNPDWVEWLMGFPRRWTDIPCGPKNRRKSRT